jgi:phosphoglycerate dehydrogenase-like enzyme
MLPAKKITLRSRSGLIGLGYLGSRITRRLIAAGFPVTVYDLDHTKRWSLPTPAPKLRGIWRTG